MTRATPAPHPRAAKRARIRQGPARAQRSEHGRSWVGAQARGAAPTELAGWYFVIGPARIDCAVASKWRNRYCASAVSVPTRALAAHRDGLVPYFPGGWRRTGRSRALTVRGLKEAALADAVAENARRLFGVERG